MKNHQKHTRRLRNQNCHEKVPTATNESSVRWLPSKLQRSKWQETKQSLRELNREDIKVYATVYGTFACILASMTFIATAEKSEESQKDSYSAEVEHVYEDFVECIQPHAAEVKLRFAFPSYPLQEAIRNQLEDCREKHPLPQSEAN